MESLDGDRACRTTLNRTQAETRRSSEDHLTLSRSNMLRMILGAGSLLVSFSLAYQIAEAQPSGRTPEQIIAEHFAALGGLEAIHALYSLEMSGKVFTTSSEVDRFYQLEWRRPANLRLKFMAQGRMVTSCYDGEKGWFAAPEHRAEGFSGAIKYLQAIKRTADYNELDILRVRAQWLITPLLCYDEGTCRAELLRESQSSNDLRIRLIYEDGMFDVVQLAPHNLHVIKAERFLAGGSDARLRGSFSRYLDVGGVKMAHNRTLQSEILEEESWQSQSEARIEDSRFDVRIDQIIANKEVEKCHFAMPNTNLIKDAKIMTPKLKKFTEQYRTKDDKIRAALHIRRPTKGVTWNQVSWDSTSGVSGYPVTIAYEDVFIENLSEAFCALFPRCYVSPSPVEPSDFDLTLELDFSGEVAIALYVGNRGGSDLPVWASTSVVRHVAFSISSSASVFDGEGRRIDLIRAVYAARRLAQGWSAESTARTKAARALKHVLESILRDVQQSGPIRDHLASLDELRQKPANLTTTVAFDDLEGHFPDRRLDAGEEARIVISVANNGPGPAFGVALRVTTAVATIDLDRDFTIGELKPGEKKEVVVPVTAGLQLLDRSLRFSIETTEKRGYGAPTVLLEVEGASLQLPQIVIAHVSLNDRIGRAQGDGDGRPANGETIEVTIRVENRGMGDAIGVQVHLVDPPVSVLELRGELPRIPAGGASNAIALLQIPPGYSADQLPLRVVAVDVRGPEVGQAEMSQSWPILHKQPLLKVEHRLYDGTSPGSSGNRDGVASNGETIELGLVVMNQGDLAARDVRLSVEPEHSGLAISTEKIEIGQLPPGSRAREHRLPIVISRRVGAGTPLDRLKFSLRFHQTDFPSSEEILTVAFEARKPSLKLVSSAPNVIARGSQDELLIQLWNLGTIDAKDVQVEVKTSTIGIEFYKLSRGIPTNHLSFAVGSVAAGDRPLELRFIALARQDAAVNAGTIKMVVSQRDFPPVETTINLKIDDRVTVIRTEPKERQPVPATVSKSEPSIFLGGRENGEQTRDESIDLLFEIHIPASTRIRNVSLSQVSTSGKREIAIGSPLRVEPSAHGTVTTYREILQLGFGPNHLTVTVTTEDGGTGRRIFSINRVPDEGKIWVVAIGIGDYAHVSDLAYARQDAQAVYEYYRASFRLPEDRLFLLLDENATRRRIVDLLGTDLPKKARNPDDTVILYFAGHGLIEPDPGSPAGDGIAKYLASWDAEPDYLLSTAIDMEQIRQFLDRIAAERVIVLADTCFSGAVGGRNAEGLLRSPLTEGFLERLVSGNGRIILTASGAKEVARESSSRGHGVFTYHLLQGLAGRADVDCDGIVTVGEIFSYVSARVNQETEGRQNPKLSGDQSKELIVGRSMQACPLDEKR